MEKEKELAPKKEQTPSKNKKSKQKSESYQPSPFNQEIKYNNKKNENKIDPDTIQELNDDDLAVLLEDFDLDTGKLKEGGDSNMPKDVSPVKVHNKKEIEKKGKKMKKLKKSMTQKSIIQRRL